MAGCDQTNIPEVNNDALECEEFVNDVCVNFTLANAYLGLPADSSLRDTMARIQRMIQANQRLVLANEEAITALNALDFTTINIGDWDMDADSTLDVAHGLTATEWQTIRSIEVIIRNDADDTYYELTSADITGAQEGSVVSFDATNISLRRTAGGIFDGTDFDSTTFNRGFITIKYTNS